LWLDDLLHRPLVGDDVALTINLPAQQAADEALGRREGAVVVMDIQTGAILVMPSHPTYDPNQLDEQWDSLRQDERAPLLNRATQGVFPVGDLARLIGLIGLYEAGATIPMDPRTMPLTEMMAPLGEAGYLATAHQLGLSRNLPGLPSQPGLLPDFDEQGTVRDLAVTPLHLARVVAALENGGDLPQPILSLITQGTPLSVVSVATARRTRPLLTQVDEQIIGLSGQATPEDTGQASLSWFVGLAPTTAIEFSPVPQGELILDPTKIEVEPTPGRQEVIPITQTPARYVVVAVVVTDKPDGEEAFQAAIVSLKTILGLAQ
jgi:hypothetical protein